MLLKAKARRRNGGWQARTIFTSISAAFVLLNGAAVGQTDDRANCMVSGPDSEARIAACTRSIDSKKYGGRDLTMLFLYRSSMLRRMGQADRAFADASEAVRLEPGFATARNERGAVHALRKDHARAVEDFTEALRLDPRYFIAVYNRGINYVAMQQYDKAITDFDVALKLNPNDAMSYNHRGEAYRLRRDLDRAIADYTKAIELNPRLNAAYNNRGLVLTDLREYDRALADFDESFRIVAQNPPAFNNRGRLYTLLKQYDRALADLNEAVRLVPANPVTYRNRAFTYEAMGDREKALADWRTALRIDPSNRGAQLAIERLQRDVPAGRERRRVALVIGNATYRNVGVLANPTNDASDIAALLKRLGFDVIEGVDLDRRSMQQKIDEFVSKLAGASVALFFYAGHGMQVEGRNHLIPIDAKFDGVRDLSAQTIEVGQVVARMEAEQRANLIFLDACRDNPLGKASASLKSSVGQGLAPIQNSIGTLTAFATKPHHVALDGAGRNSPFTASLLRHAATPGLEIGAVLKCVRNDVFQSTGGKQVPFDESSLITDIVLAQ